MKRVVRILVGYPLFLTVWVALFTIAAVAVIVGRPLRGGR